MAASSLVVPGTMCQICHHSDCERSEHTASRNCVPCCPVCYDGWAARYRTTEWLREVVRP